MLNATDADCSDARLTHAVAGVIAVPRVEPADSFVLHAPLELLARAELLRHVPPAARDAAREQLIALATQYDAAGAPVEPPRPGDFESVAAGAAHLVAAIGAGELDDVDVAASWLAGHASADELVPLLAPAIVPSLAAAAHAPIALYLMSRGDIGATGLRGVARELARYPDWRLTWFDGAPSPGRDHTRDIIDAISEVPALGVPGSTFIYPIMSQVEEVGVAAALLGPALTPDLDFSRAALALQHAAVWSMITEPDDHVAYGWTHCLTMPQAVLHLGGRGITPRIATAVAATFVAGFRAALAQRALEPIEPAPLPAGVAGARWTTVADAAARHHDAHFVKYTVACMHAARGDASHEDVYLRAAERLARWWAAQDALTATA